LIDDIVDFGGTAQTNLFLEAVQVQDAAELALDVLKATNELKSTNVGIVCESDIPRVQADKKALSRILRHLLGNAVKFSPQGGSVEVRGRLNPETGKVRVEVQDHGIGIAQDQLESIFESFYQADGSTTRRYSGTGIGLALVRQLLEKHDSSIEVESEVGVGSTFSFELPAAAEEL